MRAALGVIGAGRPFTRARRRRSAARALAAGLTLALGVAFAAPASAQTAGPATQGTASAYGLSGSGLVTIAPTPTVSVGTPGLQQQIAVPVDADPLLINATLKARAECRVEPTVPQQISEIDEPQDAPFLAPNNCDGYAETEGLRVLLSGATGDTPLVSADLIEAEAATACVNGRGRLSRAYNIVNLKVGGNDVPLVEETFETVLDLTDPEGGALAPVVSITKGELTPNGITALHIRVLPGGAGTAAQHILVSHAEATMDTPCGVAAAPRNPDLGAGPDLGPGAGPLPRTGSNEMVALPLALGMLATAVVLRRVNRRARRATA